MYSPAAFTVENRQRAIDFIGANGFASVVSQPADGPPIATHTPLIAVSQTGPLRLFGHFARANPQAQAIDGHTRFLCIFSGAHAYISPRWYQQQPAVPTWNYQVVHASGVAHPIHDLATLKARIDQLIDTHDNLDEQQRQQLMPADYIDKMLKGIAGFELQVDQLEMKSKLGQNRSTDDRQSVIAALSESNHSDDLTIATLMSECN